MNPEQKQFYLLGESLTPYAGHPDGPDLDHYHEMAARFRKRCRELFAPKRAVEHTAEPAISADNCSRPVGPHNGA